MPPPVLIPRLQRPGRPRHRRTGRGPAPWPRRSGPGGLTLILHAQPSLDWDLGETKGTVALRMPDDDVALELLTPYRTAGRLLREPHRPGRGADRRRGRRQLAESVEVYLEGGFRPVKGDGGVPSTIVDATVRTLAGGPSGRHQPGTPA